MIMIAEPLNLICTPEVRSEHLKPDPQRLENPIPRGGRSLVGCSTERGAALFRGAGLLALSEVGSLVFSKCSRYQAAKRALACPA